MKTLLGKIKDNAGFSFIELMAVMFIVNVGLVALISMSLQAVQTERFNRNILVAAQLSQEGIELVRNIRDGYWLNGIGPWPPMDGSYAIDYQLATSTLLTGGVSDNSSRLYMDANGYYSHDSSGAPTKFRRAVTIHASGIASTTVDSEVRFNDGIVERNYKVETILYDWK